MTTIIFDTETTGLPLHTSVSLDKQPRVIEFAAVILDGDEVVKEYEALINPECKLEPIITKITGLTDDDLKEAPTFDRVASEVRDLFASADTMVAHNLPFDHQMIAMEVERIGPQLNWAWPPTRICTVQEWTDHYGYRPKLVQLYEDLTGEKFEQKHRALDDVHKLVRVWRETR